MSRIFDGTLTRTSARHAPRLPTAARPSASVLSVMANAWKPPSQEQLGGPGWGWDTCEDAHELGKDRDVEAAHREECDLLPVNTSSFEGHQRRNMETGLLKTCQRAIQ